MRYALDCAQERDSDTQKSLALGCLEVLCFNHPEFLREFTTSALFLLSLACSDAPLGSQAALEQLKLAGVDPGYLCQSDHWRVADQCLLALSSVANLFENDAAAISLLDRFYQNYAAAFLTKFKADHIVNARFILLFMLVSKFALAKDDVTFEYLLSCFCNRIVDAATREVATFAILKICKEPRIFVYLKKQKFSEKVFPMVLDSLDP